MALGDAKSGRDVDPTLRPDSGLAFRRPGRQTHGAHRTQGIIFADESDIASTERIDLCIVGNTNPVVAVGNSFVGGKTVPQTRNVGTTATIQKPLMSARRFTSQTESCKKRVVWLICRSQLSCYYDFLRTNPFCCV